MRRRIRLFELEDCGWFPGNLRDEGTDFLRFVWQVSGAYKPVASRLQSALSRVGSTEILDLGSGGGGPVVPICKQLARSGPQVHITLSDKFPNLAAFEYARSQTNGGVSFVSEPVDATAVPGHLRGFRTMFGNVHHFLPEVVQRILQDAVDQSCGIGVFDFSAFPAPPPPLFPLLGTPLGVLLAVPFVRPFRWSRLFWTYVIPALPIFFTWDGMVSALRLYSVRELQEIVAALPSNNYIWEIGREPFPHSLTYLVGCPG